MAVEDLRAVVDRVIIDHQFRTFVTQWSDWLCSDYALSADEVEALHSRDQKMLIKLGLDETRANLMRYLM